MKRLAIFGLILLGFIIWPLTLRAGQNPAILLTPTLPCQTPTPTPAGSLTPTYTPGPLFAANKPITPTPSASPTLPTCQPTLPPPPCLPVPTPSPTPTPPPSSTPCATATPWTMTPWPTLTPCSDFGCPPTRTPWAVTPTATPCFLTPTPTATPWGTPSPTSTAIWPTSTPILCIPTPTSTPVLTPIPTTYPIFTATVNVIPHSTLVTVGDSMTTTVTLDVSEGCILPVFELTLSQTAAAPPFAPADPIVLGPGVSMPATITVTAVTTGTTTFHALVYGERNCNNSGWVWTYVHGESAPVTVTNSLPPPLQYLYLPLTRQD